MISRNYFSKASIAAVRSSHRRCFINQAVRKTFSKFTGKHLYWSLCFNDFIKKETPKLVFF